MILAAIIQKYRQIVASKIIGIGISEAKMKKGVRSVCCFLCLQIVFVLVHLLVGTFEDGIDAFVVIKP